MGEGRKVQGVLLLHGLALSPWWMRWIGRDLERIGCGPVLNWGYRRGPDLDSACRALSERLRTEFPEEAPLLDVVALSTGGLIARRLLVDGALAPGGRLVTLGTPQRGAAKAAFAVRRLGRAASWIYGANIRDLEPGSAFLDALPPPPAEQMLVIYAGTGKERGKSRLVPGDNDGTVEVSSARVAGAREVFIPHLRHWWLSFSPRVRAAIVAEFQGGRVL